MVALRYRNPAAAAAAVAASLLSACVGEGASTAGAAMVRDSAGVRIVEHSGPLSEAPIALELVWEHGRAADDYQFQFVFVGALQPDGGAVVADGGNAEVVAIGPDGVGYGLLAASGEGPNEVRGPAFVEVTGQDTVWVGDRGNGKLMRFEGGELAGTISTAGDRELTFGLLPIAVTDDGDFLMQTGSYRTDLEQPWLDGTLARFDPTTRQVDTVGSYPMAPRRPETGINPFAAFGVVAAGGGRFVTARMDVPELVWRGADGALVQTVRWQPALTYPNDAMLEAFLERLIPDLRRVNPGMPSDRLDQFLEEQRARYAIDPSLPLPLFGLMRASSAGDVWLPEFVGQELRVGRHLVLSADGLALGAAIFPQPFQVLDANDRFVLGVHADELDVLSVAVYAYRAGS